MPTDRDRELAGELAKDLLANMSDRKGFDFWAVDEDVRVEWGDKWTDMIAALLARVREECIVRALCERCAVLGRPECVACQGIADAIREGE